MMRAGSPSGTPSTRRDHLGWVLAERGRIAEAEDVYRTLTRHRGP